LSSLEQYIVSLIHSLTIYSSNMIQLMIYEIDTLENLKKSLAKLLVIMYRSLQYKFVYGSEDNRIINQPNNMILTK
jgi:hypothetical protein